MQEEFLWNSEPRLGRRRGGPSGLPAGGERAEQAVDEAAADGRGDWQHSDDDGDDGRGPGEAKEGL